MTKVDLRGIVAAVAAVTGALALSITAAHGQDQVQVPSTALVGEAAPQRDCSRWPASVFDETSASCVCPQGMWWNLRGDACLPREHAAGEFCQTVWPASSPFFVSGGGYRCVCAPPLLWDSQATACRPPASTGDADCTAEWPGTLPVLSPSGTEFECRCPGGRRWEEASRSCVTGAPVIPVARGFYNEGAVPPGPGGIPPAPTPVAPAYPGAGPSDPAPGDAPGAALPPPPAVPSEKCARLLAEIRGRAQAGQVAEAEAVGMKAAVAGCDPAAISEASRAKQ